MDNNIDEARKASNIAVQANRISDELEDVKTELEEILDMYKKGEVTDELKKENKN